MKIVQEPEDCPAIHADEMEQLLMYMDNKEPVMPVGVTSVRL
jgi:hypothetical protein